MTTNMFSPEAYAATRRPISKASPLPGWCYADPEWYARELEAIFRGPNSEWLYIGHASMVPNPGDYFTFKLFGEPLIIVRGTNGEVNVLSAVCRHRGAVIAEGEGRCRAFVCPYHSWTYSLDGKLIGLPGTPSPLEGVEGFDKADHGLSVVRSDIWAGAIFVTFNKNSQPLKEKLAGVSKFLENYELDDLRHTYRKTYDVDCDWKAWVENSLENYHVAYIHRKYYDPQKPQNWIFEETDESFDAMYSARSVAVYSGLPSEMPRLNEKEKAGLYHVWITPNLHLIVTSTYIRFRQHLPLAPGRFTLIDDWTFSKDTIARPEFQQVVNESDKYYARADAVAQEDLWIAGNVQKGLGSGAYRPGRYVIEEKMLHKLANYVVDRVVGLA